VRPRRHRMHRRAEGVSRHRRGGAADGSKADSVLLEVIERLVDEFADTLDRVTVARVVRDCHRDLAGSPVAAIPELVERLAREELAALAADLLTRDGTAGSLPSVVVLLVSGPLVAPTGGGTGSTGGAGWVLECWGQCLRGWVEPLAGRGAAPAVRPRIAQAVAVRVLGERGVEVRGWHLAGAEDRLVFRAGLRCSHASPSHRQQSEENGVCRTCAPRAVVRNSRAVPIDL
jgi:hypothetical protein